MAQSVDLPIGIDNFGVFVMPVRRNHQCALSPLHDYAVARHFFEDRLLDIVWSSHVSQPGVILRASVLQLLYL